MRPPPFFFSSACLPTLSGNADFGCSPSQVFTFHVEAFKWSQLQHSLYLK